MKNIVFFVLALLLSDALIAQDCKVLLDDLKGTYEGVCKKGLANLNGNATGKYS